MYYWRCDDHGGLGSHPIHRLRYNPKSRFLVDHGYDGLGEVSIRAVKDIGETEVRDFEVEGSHVFFFRNGTMAHNCDDFAIFASSILFALGMPHYLVMGYYHAVGGHVWVEVEEGPRVYLLEFMSSTLYILDKDGAYDGTLYMPMERVLVR